MRTFVASVSNMRRLKQLRRLLLGSAIAIGSVAHAAPTFLSTTVTPIGQAQPGWTVAAVHGGFNDGFAGFTGTFGSAFYWGAESGLPLIANNATGSNGGIGSYEYFSFRQSFDLTGYNPATAILTFNWGCDDVPSSGAVGWMPVFSLNGGALQGAGTCGAYSAGSLVALSSGFTTGINTLTFYVEGNGQTDGLGLITRSFTASATGTVTPVPEPWSLGLLGIGVVGYAVTSRSSARRAPQFRTGSSV